MKLALFISGIILIFLVFWLFPESDYDIKNYPSSGTEIVAFGDSLVSGVGASEGKDFVSVLSNLINASIINLGKGGETTSSGLLRINEVLNTKPKIVLLLLGGNDYLRRTPSSQTFRNLGTIITEIQETGAIVILLGVRGGLLSDGYENKYEDLAREYQTAYVPNVLDGVFGNSDLMSDGIHPNDAGHERIANKIYPVISKLLY